MERAQQFKLLHKLPLSHPHFSGKSAQSRSLGVNSTAYQQQEHNNSPDRLDRTLTLSLLKSFLGSGALLIGETGTGGKRPIRYTPEPDSAPVYPHLHKLRGGVI
jgi:hypothetical protein